MFDQEKVKRKLEGSRNVMVQPFHGFCQGSWGGDEFQPPANPFDVCVNWKAGFSQGEE